MSPSQKTAPCPQCGEAAVLGPDNPWRPFCSERCKMVDLDGWFSGRYAIPPVEDADRRDDERDED